MPKHLHHLFAEIYNRPQLILPSYAEMFNGALAKRFDIQTLINDQGLNLSAASIQKRAMDYEGRYEKEYKETYDGIAIIPVKGTLVSRGGVYPSSGITTYSGIRERLRAAENDASIRGILLDIDSPGGMVSNVDDTAQLIRDISKTKPVWALAYDQMTSAAYWLASAANRIIATKTAQVGSIGVLVMHADYSQHLSSEGIKVTFIHAGSRKVEGNSFAPLPDELRERIQSEVNETYEHFTRSVSEYRGLSHQAVKDTEAGIFTAAQAITHNLVDEVMAADDVLQKFSRFLDSHVTGTTYQSANSTTHSQGTTTMSKPTHSADNDADLKPVAGQAIEKVLESPEKTPPKAAAVEILEKCESSGLPFMASIFIKAELTADQADDQLAEASRIRDVCAAAGIESESIIKACGPLANGLHKAIATAITEAKAAVDPEQHSHHDQTGPNSSESAISSANIYGNRRTA